MNYSRLYHFSPTAFDINSPAMMHHCMEIIKRLVDFLNPGQVTVIAGDQPVHILGISKSS